MPNVAKNNERPAASLQHSRARQNCGTATTTAFKVRAVTETVKYDFEFALAGTKR
jgi:hypothetical protein